MTASILTSVFAHGGRTSRFGEFTMVLMHGCRFIATPMEFSQMQNWARGRLTTGSEVRDRALFVERFETVLAGQGSGVSTRGNRPQLRRIVKAMKANAVGLEGWSIPHDLDQDVEAAYVPPAETAVVTPPSAASSAHTAA